MTMNESVSPKIPPDYNGMDYFPIFGSYNWESQTNAVNCNYIIRTGDIRTLETPPDDMPNQFISLISDTFQDTFSTSIDEIRKGVLNSMNNNTEIQSLLCKSVWSKEDREEYEEILAKTVSKYMNAMPGFGEYRSSSQNNLKHLRRASWLNSISVDIETKTDGVNEYEFQCEVMAIEGIVAQQVENELLKSYICDDQTSWKRPMSYFMVSGFFSRNDTHELSGHRWIITPTGNIIESTHDPDIRGATPPYKKTSSSLELWARGQPAYIEQYDDVYGSYDLDDQGDEYGNLVRSNLPPYRHQFYVPSDATFSADGQFAFGSIEDNGVYKHMAFQKMDVGTPHERYVVLDYQESRSPDYEFRYEDVLDGYTYRFQSQGDGHKIDRYQRGIQNRGWWKWDDITAPPSPCEDNRTGYRQSLGDEFQENKQSLGIAVPEEQSRGMAYVGLDYRAKNNPGFSPTV